MKRFNLRLFLAVLSVLALNMGVCTAQAKFGLDTAQKTGQKVKIEQTEYEVWATAKTGSEFIKLQSTHGNTYALWIGKETGETIDDMPVRVTSSGKLFIIVLSKNGNPYNKYLK